MTSKNRDSWTQRSGRAPLSEQEFQRIRKAARDLPEIAQQLYEHLTREQEVLFAHDFLDIRDVGISRSRDDAFAGLERMSGEDMTMATEEWFKKVARFYLRAANALMQRKLDETKPWDAKEMQSVPVVALSLLSSILKNMHNIEEVFPPGQVKKKQ